MSYTVLTAFGTRPEAIKLAPVISAVERDPLLRSRVLVTAQHRDLLDQALEPFGIVPDVDLNLMRPGHTLAELTARVVEQVDRVLADEKPDVVLVQGDTTTVFAASLAAFYRGVPVGHVEAGLRSFDMANPFPEEGNRQLTSRIARLHFVPTQRAAQNLLSEGISAEHIFRTGNTVIDALRSVARRRDLPPPPSAWRNLPPDGACPVLVTLHRRESWGEPLEGICRALRRVADDLPQLTFVFPVHPQPRVRETTDRLLCGHARISLIEPLGYLEFVAAMRACAFVVTDSGGIQEEAPVLAKPVLVLRGVTERPEAVEAGTSFLVGTDEADVYAHVASLATDAARRDRMAHAVSPFGDGRASERIVSAIHRFAGLPPFADEPPQLP
jgi:UDP-N-acetylglucosamine 2-epimerase (non-hydrolysing)